MASIITVSGEWLRSIQQMLATVETSGQAFAAIWAAKAFADEAATAVKAGGSWWNPDPWRTAAARELEEAGIQISREESPYSEGSTTRIDTTRWSTVAAKISNLYALAQLTRQGFPEDADPSEYDSSLIQGAAEITQAILDAPKAAATYVLETVGSVVDKAAETAGKAARKVVREAGGVVKEAAGQVSEAAGAAIPWKVLLAGGLILGAAVGGVYFLARSGAIKQIGGVVHG